MRTHLVPFVLIVVLLTACGAPAPAADAAAQSPTSSSTQPSVSSEPNPLNVQVSVDTSLAASELISTAGGTVSVEAADGTQFTLTFPEGALQSDEMITLTPLSGIEGLPFSGGLVGGVQMAPEGLRLFQPATLTIESPNTVAAEGFETVAFGYHEDGQGVYLNTSDVSGNILMLEIWHFSGVAAAQATQAEIQTQQQQHIPSNAEDAFTQGIQEYIGRERQAQLLGEPDANFQDRISEFLREAYDSFIAPQLPIALEDCAKAPAIISKALGWARQAELMGSEDEFRADINKVIDTYEQVKEKCNQNYTGEGKYRISAGTSGIEVVSGYEFQITFRANTDGTITGEGSFQKVEASNGGEQAGMVMQCTFSDLSSLTFPPMKVSGTVKKDPTGQADDTFQLTIEGLPSTNTIQETCSMTAMGFTQTTPAIDFQDIGFFLSGIEIAAKDGAQANGADSNKIQGATGGTTWELEIHKQANP